MKIRIFAILFLTLGLAILPALAEQAEAVDAVAESTDLKSTTEKDNSRVVIDFADSDGIDADAAAADIKQAIGKLEQVFGEEFGSELSKELENLDDDELRELGSLFKGTSINFGDGDGLGFGEFMIAMTAITFSLGLPVIVLVLVLVFSHRKRKQKMELVSNFLQADQPVPEHIMAEFDSSSSANTPFYSGLKYTLGGIAFALAFILMGDSDIAAFGLIPIAIGAAKLIAWKFDK